MPCSKRRHPLRGRRKRSRAHRTSPPRALPQPARRGSLRPGFHRGLVSGHGPQDGALRAQRRGAIASAWLLADPGSLAPARQCGGHPQAARDPGPLADRERAHRRGAGRGGRAVVLAPVRAGDPGRPHIRPRRGGHEGRHRCLHHGVPRTSADRPAARRASVPAVGGGGGMHRQRRARLPALGLR
jgi:hypothetical protein